MLLLDLIEMYCEKDGDEYITHDHCFRVEPASEEALKSFEENCLKYGIEDRICAELLDFYRQSNSLFNFFSCDDETIFEWWQDSKELWLGNLDMDTFRYSAERRKYGIGAASNFSYGKEYEFDTLEDMIEAYVKGCS